MHMPSQQLRQAAERGDEELLRAVQALFVGDALVEDDTTAETVSTKVSHLSATDAAANEH